MRLRASLALIAVYAHLIATVERWKVSTLHWYSLVYVHCLLANIVHTNRLLAAETTQSTDWEVQFSPSVSDYDRETDPIANSAYLTLFRSDGCLTYLYPARQTGVQSLACETLWAKRDERTANDCIV